MKKNNILTYFLLLVSAFIIFFPLIYAMLASFMPTIDIVTGKIIPSSIDLKNYRELIKIFPMGKFFTNSLITSIAGMVSQVIICSMTAYAIVFVDFKNKKLVFLSSYAIYVYSLGSYICSKLHYNFKGWTY